MAAGLRQGLDRAVRLARRMSRHWRFGVGATLVCAALLSVPVSRYRERFLSTAVIYQQQLADPESIAAGPVSGVDPTVLHEMLLEYRRLSLLIEELGLYQSELQQQGPAAAVAEFRSNVAFKPLGRNTFRISFVGDSAEQAQAVTARLTQSLVDEDFERRTRQATSGEAFFAAEMSRAAVELRAAEQKLEQFVAENPAYSIALLPEPGADPVAPRRTPSEVRPAPAPPRGRAAYATGRPATRGDGEDTAEAGLSTSPAIAEPDPAMVAERDAARAAVSAANTRLAELRTRFTDDHPNVLAAVSTVSGAQARLEAAEAAIHRSAADSLYSAPSQRAAPEPQAPPTRSPARAPRAARLAAPDPAGDDAAKQANAADGTVQAALDTEWARLAREVGDARKRHERLASDAFRSQVASRSLKAGYGLGVVVLDEASPPDKPIRSRGLVAALAAFGTLLLGLGLTLARALLDDRIFDETDLAGFGLDPILAVIPALKLPLNPSSEGRQRGQSPERA